MQISQNDTMCSVLPYASTACTNIYSKAVLPQYKTKKCTGNKFKLKGFSPVGKEHISVLKYHFWPHHQKSKNGKYAVVVVIFQTSKNNISAPNMSSEILKIKLGNYYI